MKEVRKTSKKKERKKNGEENKIAFDGTNGEKEIMWVKGETNKMKKRFEQFHFNEKYVNRFD